MKLEVKFLRDFLTTYKIDDEIVATPSKYYNEFIYPNVNTNKKFDRFNKIVLCPFHYDTDESMGVFIPKTDKNKKEIFNCFGCKTSGDVVRMHQLWVKELENRNIDVETAVIELATIYKIPLEDVDILTGSEYLEFLSNNINEKYLKNKLYTFSELENDLDTLNNHRHTFSDEQFKEIYNNIIYTLKESDLN